MKNNPPFLQHLSAEIGKFANNYTPLLILLLAIVIFSIVAPNFLTVNNFKLMIRQMSFVSIDRGWADVCDDCWGIDLSVRSQIILTECRAFAHDFK